MASRPIGVSSSQSLEEKYLQPSLNVLRRLLREPVAPINFIEIPNETWRTFLVGLWHEEPEDAFEEHWCSMGHRDYEEITLNDWQSLKVALCVIMFAPPGYLKAGDFSVSGYKLRTSPYVAEQIDRLHALCMQFTSPLALLTDETMSAAFDIVPSYYRSSEFDDPDDDEYYNVEILSIDSFPVRYALAGLIHLHGLSMDIVYTGLRPIRRRLGAAIQHPLTVESLSDAFASRHSFSDWDLFTMQRSRVEWELFKDWKQAIAVLALIHPYKKGDIIKLKTGASLANHYVLVRPSLPETPLPLPPATLASVTMVSRPRDHVIDSLLANSAVEEHLSDIEFRVTTVKPAGKHAYSQILFGTLGDTKTKLCLKLYDERLFNIDDIDDYDDCFSHNPSNRLNDLITAVDLAKTEEAAYDRLAHLQGTLVPHFYGVHQYELPNGTKLWGSLMEFIDCPTLEHVDASKWSEEVQIDFVHRMRHALKALRYAGIRHGDEQARNILCPSIARQGSEAPGIVIIDFGHSEFWLSDEDGAPPEYYIPCYCPHFQPLLIEAGIDAKLVSEHWEPLDDFEF
ncbi:hypothetical protein OBBRIDRAFT_794614 [Obba rivulosa]|uniref:Protein kinase domain-containing protein n=1 Tax=Obba rivulosa TaxID=1052685 RepID=A0A8E2DKQ7_9APHY|nr:hypothetical protein OBBRIDRAFT_794614 [Obba rivulosa]